MSGSRAGEPGDPAPEIIDLLLSVRLLLSRLGEDYVLPPEKSIRPDEFSSVSNRETIRRADAIIGAWERRENMEELRLLLGVGPGKKRRRVRTAIRETGIAMMYIGLEQANAIDIKKTVCSELQVDEKEVERAVAAWRETIEQCIASGEISGEE